MRNRQFWFLIILVLGVVCVPIQVLAGIDFSLTPINESYSLRDPITLQLEIQNNNKDEALIVFANTGPLGLKFNCADPSALTRLRSKSQIINGAKPVAPYRLKVGDKLTRIVVLNRYLILEKAKKYSVDFEETFTVYPPYDKALYDAGKITTTTLMARGNCEITLLDSLVDTKLIEQNTADIKSDDKNKALDALEMLLWTDDPTAFAPLATSTMLFPDSTADILQTLDTLAKSSILNAARNGSRDDLSAVLDLYLTQHQKPPRGFMQEMLASPDTDKVFEMMAYLMRNGDRDDVVLVEPLTHGRNDDIQGLAKQFIDKFRRERLRREPAPTSVTPPATAPPPPATTPPPAPTSSPASPATTPG